MKLIEKNISFRTILGSRTSTTAAIALLAGAALLLPSEAHATKKVYNPYVDQGELEVEWKAGVTHDSDDDEQDGAWKQKLGVGYGFTDRLFIEAYGEVEREGGEDADFTAVELEAKYELTEPGEYWVDVGLLGEYEINTLGGPDKVEAKLLLAKDVGQFSHTANLKLEREVGDEADDETEAGLAWSSRYRYSRAFEPGFEIHSDFGSLSDSSSFNDQGHQFGPVVYGQLGAFKYDVGYLIGVSDSAPDGEAKVILEYEYYF
jgi:hypothetical protein